MKQESIIRTSCVSVHFVANKSKPLVTGKPLYFEVDAGKFYEDWVT